MFQKITRNKLREFLTPYATGERTLNLGAGGYRGYDALFPNNVSADIDVARKPDVVADAHTLPFKDGEFAVVLSLEMLEHVKDPRQVVREFARVLKPGGLLLLSTRFVYPLHDTPHDYWRFTKYGLRELFTGWDIVELREETGTMETLAVLFQRLVFQTDTRGGKLTKVFFFLCTKLFEHLSWLLKKEYGSILKDNKETNILSSGYYLAARKHV